MAKQPRPVISRDNPEPEIADMSDGTHADLLPAGVQQEQPPLPSRDTGPPPQPEAEPESERIDSSPFDVKRKAIMAKARREDSEEYEPENLTPALFGRDHRATKDEPEPDIDVQPQRPDQVRVHGNQRIPLIFGQRQIDVPMGQLRQLAIESGVPIDNLTDQQVVAVGRNVVAQRLMYDELQRRGQEQQQQPEEEVSEEQPNEFEDFVHEMQFGEEAEAAKKFQKIVDDRARQIAAAVTEHHRTIDYEQRQVQDIVTAGQTAAKMPGYARAVQHPLFQPTLQAAIRQRMVGALVQVFPGDALQPFDTPEKQGRLVRELRARNVPFPSDRDLVEGGYRDTVGIFAGQQQGQAQPVTVDLSTSRSMRPRQATPQPRASSAAPQAAPPIPRGRAIVMEMRAKRGQTVA